jgi:hypothetical protein
MISNERPSPYGYRPSHGHHSHSHHQHQYSGPKPPSNEETLRTEKIQIERKTFIMTLKENPRGRFLRITEDVGGRRDTIIIPATGLEDFKKVLEEMVNTSAETPLKVEGAEEEGQ